MGINLGIDMGSGATKIVGILNENYGAPDFCCTEDSLLSIETVFENFIRSNNLNIHDIERIMITGVRSSYVDNHVNNMPVEIVDEFQANGLGAGYMMPLHEFITVSMGTGTSLVRVCGKVIEHIGGIGVGGGTMLGLSKVVLNTQDVDKIIEMAQKGNLERIDLQIKDISRNPLPGLPLNATASSFGKVTDDITPEDLALGIINLVLQRVGEAAILASINGNIKDFVFIGNMTRFPQCGDLFPLFEEMFGVRFIIPAFAEYRTAVGAILAKCEGNY